MSIKSRTQLVKNTLKAKGVLRLAPAWVPRSFLIPGGRIKLHPTDLYALGAYRGGIDERWLASTTLAENGPNTPTDEGLSYVVLESEGTMSRLMLKEAIELAGDEILGKETMKKHAGWKVLCKLFDNKGPIPHHMHQMEEHARNVGKSGKPEAYYFPPQLNMKTNDFPYTFFGLEPGTTKDQVKQCLKDWDKGDNGILYLSRAYKLKPGSGWNVPSGILHAPGSLVTYELQRPFDIYGMFQSMVDDRRVPWELLVKDVPEDKHHDLDYIVGMLDWEQNTDPEFGKNHAIEPKPVMDEKVMQESGYIENWIVYGTTDFKAKELTILPGRSVTTINDDGAYGLLVVQGRGTLNGETLECPTMIRYGELTKDEYFITAESAKNDVKIKNTSEYEKLVILKHFGPDI